MPRIPLATPEDSPAEVRELLDALPVKLAIFRLMAVAPTHFRPLVSLGTSILSQQELDAKLREFAILQAAALTPGEYEWVQHVPIAKAVGASDEQIEALQRGDYGADCFDAKERALLELGRQALADPRVDAALFDAAREHFSPREIVELMLTLGYYSMLARLTEVVELEVDAAAGTAIVDNLS